MSSAAERLMRREFDFREMCMRRESREKLSRGGTAND